MRNGIAVAFSLLCLMVLVVVPNALYMLFLAIPFPCLTDFPLGAAIDIHRRDDGRRPRRASACSSGDRQAGSYFDLSQRGLVGSFIALLLVTALNAVLPIILGSRASESITRGVATVAHPVRPPDRLLGHRAAPGQADGWARALSRGRQLGDVLPDAGLGRARGRWVRQRFHADRARRRGASSSRSTSPG